MKNLPKSIRMLPAVLTLIFGACSNSTQISDGGSHVGNPEIDATISALQKLYTSVKEQNIKNYIDTTLLNPTDLIPKQKHTAETFSPAKKRSPVAEMSSVDTLLYNDTLFIVDTTVVIDTIERKTTKYVRDTNQTSWGMEEVMVQKRVIDSVFVMDTILTYSSLIITDSLFIPESGYDISPAPIFDNSQRKYEYIEGEMQYAYTKWQSDSLVHVFVSEGDTNIIVVNSNKYHFSEATADISSLEKNLVRKDNSRCNLRYVDHDGDSLLFFAQQGRPQILLDQSIDSAGHMVRKSIVFDCGIDLNYQSTYNHTVHSLTYTIFYDNDLSNNIVWNMSRDTGLLSIEYTHPTDSIEMEKKIYTYNILDEIPTDIAQATQTLRFKIGKVYKAVLTIVPSTIWSSDQKPAEASVFATVYLTDGSRFALEGKIEQGCFSGTITNHKSGTEKDIERVLE